LIEIREWMVLMLVVDEEGNVLKREHVVKMVGDWMEGVSGEGVEVEGGVWGGDVFMG
jgi:hypothetical protein